MNNLLIQAKTRRDKLQEEINELDIVIKYLTINAKSSVELNGNNKPKATSKTARAAEICGLYIANGGAITTANQFMTLINNEGIFLSRAGLNQALSRARLYFDKDDKIWKLKM